MQILLVENELKIGRYIETGLRQNMHSVKWVQSCVDARNALCDKSYDIVVLTRELPDGDGLELLKEWRQAAFSEPVIILSGRNQVADRVDGLNEGADDYLVKPFCFSELLARIQSVYRRLGNEPYSVLEHHNLRMDLVAHTVTLEGMPVDLTRREYSIIALFLKNKGRVLTRTLIAEKIWETPCTLDSNLIDVYIRKLRGKLEKRRTKPLIKTVRGVGYQLV